MANKVWKIRNTQSGLFYVSMERRPDSVGKVFTYRAEADQIIASLANKQIRPYTSHKWNAKKGQYVEKVYARKKESVMAAFTWELIEYDLALACVTPAAKHERVMEVVAKYLEPRDIVKVRQEINETL